MAKYKILSGTGGGSGLVSWVQPDTSSERGPWVSGEVDVLELRDVNGTRWGRVHVAQLPGRPTTFWFVVESPIGVNFYAEKVADDGAAPAGDGVDFAGFVGPVPCEIRYRTNARKIHPEAARRLAIIGHDAGLDHLTLTSTYRTPEDQIRVMYNNLASRGPDYSYKLYGSAGDEVVTAYVDAKAAGGGEQEIKAAMLRRIYEVGPGHVSRHLGIPGLVVVDISSQGSRDASSRAQRWPVFEASLDKAKAVGWVSKWIGPPRDPAFHVELDMPGVDPTAEVL